MSSKPELEQPSLYADAYVGVSEEVRDHILRLGFPKATVIPNGIDCKRFYPKKPVSPKLTTVLSLCQSDKANAFIQKCCKAANVKFLRCEKHTDNVWAIEDMINQSDLVVGLGRSAYDAMACGRAALVYDFREHHMGEFLGEGMLTPDNIEKSMSCNCTGKASRLKFDEQGFIAEMQKYSPELAAWSREYALENLNIEVAVRKYLDIYKGIDYKEAYKTIKPRLFKAMGVQTCDTIMQKKRRQYKRVINSLIVVSILLLITTILLLFIK